MKAFTKNKSAFDGFKNRWLPPIPLVYPQPAGFFFEGVFADEKKTLKYTTEMIIKCGRRLDNAKNQKKNADL